MFASGNERILLMKKARRIFAMIGVILILAMYGSTMVFATMKSPNAKPLLMGSIYCTIAVPVILYGMTLVAKLLKNKNDEMNPHSARTGTTPESADSASKEEDAD